MRDLWGWLQQKWTSHKRWIYLFILAAALVFLGKALYSHWQGIASIQITPPAWACLIFATGINLMAFIWTGWVWGWILQDLGQPVNQSWAVQIYLTTNIAKYLPSNLVHLYGRTLATTDIGVPLGPASLSVVLDTLLMAAAGVIVSLLSVPQQQQIFAVLGLIAILVIVHPLVLQRLVKFVPQGSKNNQPDVSNAIQLQRYPLRPLLGQILFVWVRSLSFIVTLSILTPIDPLLMPKYMSIYSLGWLLGFITPGVPGGIGILELITSTLLSQPGVLTSDQTLSVGLALGAVGIHRLVTTIAEALGAGLATLDMKFPLQRGSLQRFRKRLGG
jgi:glycosyltransferase 2 family protein